MNEEDKYLKKRNREKYILAIGLLFALVIAALFLYQHFHPEKPYNSGRYHPAQVPVGYSDQQSNPAVTDSSKDMHPDTAKRK